MEQQIATILGGIAQQLGVAVEYLWPILVRYTWSVAATNIGVCIFLLIVITGASHVTRRWIWQMYATKLVEGKAYRESGSGRYYGGPDRDNYIIGSVITSIGQAFASGVLVLLIAQFLPAFLAPEGAAVFDLVRRVSSR